VKEQIENVLAIPAADALMISAKSGIGVEDVLEAIVHRIPPPKGSADNPFSGAGVLILVRHLSRCSGAVRVMEGRITKHMKIRLVATNEVYEVEPTRDATPKPVAFGRTGSGRTLASSSRTIKRVPMPAWATRSPKHPRPAAGSARVRSHQADVFAGIFPVLADEYEPLRDALGKLH